jgi:hypothetical protein
MPILMKLYVILSNWTSLDAMVAFKYANNYNCQRYKFATNTSNWAS